MTTTPVRPTTERPPVDPRIWNRRVEVTRARGRKRLRWVIAALGVVILLLSGFASLHSSLFGARHLSVKGAVHTPATEVLGSAGLLLHPPLVDIDAATAVRRIEALPWIKSARVAVHWPDSVAVTVTERTAVAAVAVPDQSGKGQLWALVDDTGRVLADQKIRPTGLFVMDLLVAPGRPGTDLAAPDKGGVTVAWSVPELLARRVQSIQVNPGGVVTVGISGGFSAIIGAPVDLPAKYVAIASVLAHVPLTSGDVINVSVPGEPAVGPGNARG